MKNWTLRFRAIDRDNFERLRTGKKAIETRAATVKYQPIAVNDTLTFVCGGETFQKRITNVHHWASIEEMVSEIDFKQVMPSATSLEDVKKAYASYPGYEEKIQKHGLLGFEMTDA